MKRAFLFDLNGTMIDDMQYHITAWHRILNQHGANLSLERTKEECYGRNNELLERIFPGRFTLEEQTAMIMDKEIGYQKEYLPHLKLINGLEKFIQDAHKAGIAMAIGSAAIMFNIDFVVDNMGIRKYFDVIVSADDVTKSKPDPETYIKCATLLGVDPGNCIVFEDVPKGIESAQRAGMQSVVITSMHTKEEFPDLTGVQFFIDDYNDPQLSSLLN